MFGPISGTTSNTLRRTYHVVAHPQQMTPVALAAAIHEGNVAAQRFAIEEIARGNAHLMDEHVLSALEQSSPALDATTQAEVLATQSEEQWQVLHQNPRLHAILERFSVLPSHQIITQVNPAIGMNTPQTPVPPMYRVNASRPYSTLMDECTRQLNQHPFNPNNFYASISQLHNASEAALLFGSINSEEHQRIRRNIDNLLADAKIAHSFSSQ